MKKFWIVDWITLVFHYDVGLLNQLRRRWGETPERSRGGYGYTHSATVLSHGGLYWSPEREEQGICLFLPASALAQLEEEVDEFLMWAYTTGGKATRLDLALDDEEGMLELEVMEAHLQAGRVVTRWKTYEVNNGKRSIDPTKREESGKTIYVGSRKSESFLRIYDKLAEQKARGQECEGVSHWVRCELESKGKRANALFETIVLGIDGEGVAAGRVGEFIGEYVYSLIDFKELEYEEGDSNESRHPSVEWWLRFLDVGTKSRLSLPKREQTIETVKGWFATAVAPMAAVILSAPEEYGGYEWLMLAIAEGARRFGPKHKAILVDCGADLGFGEYTDEELRELGVVIEGARERARQMSLGVEQERVAVTV